MRPDLRSPIQRDALEEAFRSREAAWILGSDVNATGDAGKTRDLIRNICDKALTEAGRSAAPPETEEDGTADLGKPVGKDSNLKTWQGDQWSVAPQIEPWPPPIPTDQAIFTVAPGDKKTVGEFADDDNE